MVSVLYVLREELPESSLTLLPPLAPAPVLLRSLSTLLLRGLDFLDSLDSVELSSWVSLSGIIQDNENNDTVTDNEVSTTSNTHIVCTVCVCICTVFCPHWQHWQAWCQCNDILQLTPLSCQPATPQHHDQPDQCHSSCSRTAQCSTSPWPCSPSPASVPSCTSPSVLLVSSPQVLCLHLSPAPLSSILFCQPMKRI